MWERVKHEVYMTIAEKSESTQSVSSGLFSTGCTSLHTVIDMIVTEMKKSIV